MKKHLKNIVKLLLEVVLTIIGIPIFILVFICGIFYTFFKHVIKFDYSIVQQTQPLLRSINLTFDGLANAGGGELINDALKIKSEIKYGKWYQTISAVTGLIKIYEKDTWLRRFLDKVLGKNHCIDAITEIDNYYYKNNFKK